MVIFPMILILVILYILSFKWNLIRIGGPAHRIVTKTVHKTLPGSGRGEGCMGVDGWGQKGGGGQGSGGGLGVVGVRGGAGLWGGGV